MDPVMAGGSFDHGESVPLDSRSTCSLTILDAPSLLNENDFREPVKADYVSHDIALAELCNIAEDYRSGADYDIIRDRYVAASFAANEFGLTAPFFRDRPKINIKSRDLVLQQPILVDQIIVDCHWLYCRGEDVSPAWPELERIFDKSTPFDVEEVSKRIASKKWSANFKVEEIFSLTERQQFQLVQMRSAAVKAKMKALLEGRLVSNGKGAHGGEQDRHVSSRFSSIRRAIREWAEQQPRVKPSVLMYESLWLARELLGPRATLKHVAELAALRCGCLPLSPKTVDEKLKALNKRLKP
jgi:hypothetical protein